MLILLNQNNTTMDKKYFVMKLIPPRADFAFTMTDAEKQVMMQHIEYWKPSLENGKLLVYGPVLDPKGPWGLAIVCVDSEDEARELMSKDPSLAINSYEMYPMRASVKQ